MNDCGICKLGIKMSKEFTDKKRVKLDKNAKSIHRQKESKIRQKCQRNSQTKREWNVVVCCDVAFHGNNNK